MRYHNQAMSSRASIKRIRPLGSTPCSSPVKQKPRQCRQTPAVTPISSRENETQPGTSSKPTIEELQHQPGTSSQEITEQSPFFTPNPYQVLQNDKEVMESASIPRDPRPPPIFVKNISNFQLLCSQLNKITGSGSYSCLSRTKDTKISPDTAETYRKIVKYLTETNADFHTYQLRQDRALRVVIRNLHPPNTNRSNRRRIENFRFHSAPDYKCTEGE